VYAALGEPARLAIVEELVTSDRSPKELGIRLEIPSNLLAHHLDVLEHAGLIARSPSAGDGRRKYVHLVRATAAAVGVTGQVTAGETLFVCTHNSARSQLAAAMWTARTGRWAQSAGTHPAERVHRGAVAAAERAGLSLVDAVPTVLDDVPDGVQVVTVCDLVHEELDPTAEWWHWSIPDPVQRGDPAAFDAVVAELEERITSVVGADGSDTR
jgi:protein-tyrosine-phosphatase/DNA-binding transcriptional ArsR family regulator